jgi:hypothetical protein
MKTKDKALLASYGRSVSPQSSRCTQPATPTRKTYSKPASPHSSLFSSAM